MNSNQACVVLLIGISVQSNSLIEEIKKESDGSLTVFLKSGEVRSFQSHSLCQICSYAWIHIGA